MEESVNLSVPSSFSTEVHNRPSSLSDIRDVLKSVFFMSLPVFLALLFQYGMALISIAFSGHLNTVDLAATGLATSIIFITAMGMGSGLASGFDIMGSQAFGAKEFRNVGILLQKTFIILGLAGCLIVALWLNIARLLKAWHEPEDVSEQTGLYLLIFIPGLIGTFIFRALRSYVQLQGIVVPPVITSFICTILHVIFNVLFVTVLKLGMRGLALASTLSMICMPLSLVLYIFFTKIHRETWFGFTTLSLANWSAFFRMAILSMLSMILRPLVLESTIILMGLVSTDALGAQAILNQIRFLCVLPSLSVSLSMCLLIGRELGAGNADRAKTIAKLVLCVTLSMSLLLDIVVISSSSVLGHVFTKDPSVFKIVYQGIPFISLYILLETVYTTLSYIVRAIGKPHFCVIVNLLGYYAVALPMGCVLTFVKKMGVNGMWIGLSSGVFVQLLVYGYIFYFRINFQHESEAARQRSVLQSGHAGKDYGSTRSDPERRDGVNGFSSVLYERDEECLLVTEKTAQNGEESVSTRDIFLKCLVFVGGGVVLLVGIVIRVALN